MNKTKLKQEGKTWVSDGIITEDQLDKIVAKYAKKDPNFIIILFAVLLTGLAFITFVFSEWAQVPHFSRTLIIIGIFIVLYILGDVLFRKRSILLGVSFITLGYIAFGAGMFLTIHMYAIDMYSAWPFIVWSIIGLLLYIIYEHKFIFVISILVTTIGQIYNGAGFTSFNWIILLVFLFGFAHFVYHRPSLLFGYLFGIGFSLQMLVLTMAESQQYYWLIIYFLVLYIVSDIVPKQVLRISLKHISLLSVFIFGMVQTFILEGDLLSKGIEYQVAFPIVWIILIGIAIWLKYRQKEQYELIDFVLFLPMIYLPFSYIIGLVSLFIFSIGWLLIGYRTENNEKIMLGTIAFLLSTFTVYIQYAWDAMNKSLFFLIGGILLFLISFSFEKQRRALLDGRKGDGEK